MSMPLDYKWNAARRSISHNDGSQKRKRKENREEQRAAYISFLLGLWPVRKR